MRKRFEPRRLVSETQRLETIAARHGFPDGNIGRAAFNTEEAAHTIAQQSESPSLATFVTSYTRKPRPLERGGQCGSTDNPLRAATNLGDGKVCRSIATRSGGAPRRRKSRATSRGRKE
jgi:hypothetical protein